MRENAGPNPTLDPKSFKSHQLVLLRAVVHRRVDRGRIAPVGDIANLEVVAASRLVPITDVFLDITPLVGLEDRVDEHLEKRLGEY